MAARIGRRLKRKLAKQAEQYIKRLEAANTKLDRIRRQRSPFGSRSR